MDLTTLHRRTVQAWQDRVAAVEPSQWALPTPCTGWTVQDLVNHVVGEERWTVPLMQGRTLEEVGDSLDGDLLGDQPARAASAAAREAVAVVDDRLPAGGKVHLSYGDEEMGEYIRQLCADHLVHGWDLAVATGGDTRMDAELVEEVATWFADREELYRDSGAIAAHVDRHGDPQTELLASFGRDAAWAATG